MLSRIAVGHGSWSGQAVLGEPRRDRQLIKVCGDTPESPATGLPAQFVAPAEASLPKTYLTRKGALILFSSREDYEFDEYGDASAPGRFDALDTDSISPLRTLQSSSDSSKHKFTTHSSSLKSPRRSARHRQCTTNPGQLAGVDLAAYIAEVKASMRRRQDFYESAMGAHFDYGERLVGESDPASARFGDAEDFLHKQESAFADETLFSPVPLHRLAEVPASSLRTVALSESWVNYISGDKKTHTSRAASSGIHLRRPHLTNQRPSSTVEKATRRSAAKLPFAEAHPQRSASVAEQPVCNSMQDGGSRAAGQSSMPAIAATARDENLLSKFRPVTSRRQPEGHRTEPPRRSKAGAASNRLDPISSTSEYESDPSLLIEEDIVLPGSESLNAPTRPDADAVDLWGTPEPILQKEGHAFIRSSTSWPSAENRSLIDALKSQVIATPAAGNLLIDDGANLSPTRSLLTARGSRSANCQDSAPAVPAPAATAPCRSPERDAAATNEALIVDAAQPSNVGNRLVQQQQLDCQSHLSVNSLGLLSEPSESAQSRPTPESNRPVQTEGHAVWTSTGSPQQRRSPAPPSVHKPQSELPQPLSATGFSSQASSDSSLSRSYIRDSGDHFLREASSALASRASATDGTALTERVDFQREEAIGASMQKSGGNFNAALSSDSKSSKSTHQDLYSNGSREPLAAAMASGRLLLPDARGGSSLGSSKNMPPTSSDYRSLDAVTASGSSAGTDGGLVQPQLLAASNSPAKCAVTSEMNVKGAEKKKKQRKEGRSRSTPPQLAADTAFDASLTANSADNDYMPPPYVTSLLSRPMIQLSDAVSAEELAVIEETLRLKLEDGKSQLAVEPALRAATATSHQHARKGVRSRGRSKLMQRSATGSVDARSKTDLDEADRKREQARRKAQNDKAERQAQQAKLSALVNEARDRHVHARATSEDRLKWLKEEEAASLATIRALQSQEDEARQALARARAMSKEEREARRLNEDQRARMAKTQQIAELQHLERAAKHKQLTLLESIVEPEAMSRLWEDERRRVEEEEWKEEQRQEEEDRRAVVEAEEEEGRIAEIEKKAEDEAMSGIMADREAADKVLAEIQLQIKELLAEMDRQRKSAAAEEEVLLERVRAFQEEQRLKEQEDRHRAQTVVQLELEAREKLRREAEHRRQHIMALRKKNLDSKASLSSIRRNQGINKSWVFSYYVHWPRETQERLIGSGNSANSADKQALSAAT